MKYTANAVKRFWVYSPKTDLTDVMKHFILGFNLHLLIARKQSAVFPLNVCVLCVLSRQESRFF